MGKSRQLSDAINAANVNISAPADSLTIDASGNLAAGGNAIIDASDVGVTVQSYDVNNALTDVAQTFTAAQRGTVVTNNTLSYDMAAGNNVVSAVSASGTLQFTNITVGQSGNITLTITGPIAVSAAAHVRINATELSRLGATGVYRVSYYSPDGTNVDVSVSSALTGAGA